MLTIHHLKNMRLMDPVTFTPEHYDMVADISTSDLGEAFEASQNIDKPWTQNDGVIAFVSRLRSTSVGDVITETHGGRAWLVAAVGFTPITRETAISWELAHGL